MRQSLILSGAFLSSALLAACGGNNTLSSPTSIMPLGAANSPLGLGNVTRGLGSAPLGFGNGARGASNASLPEGVVSSFRQEGTMTTFDDKDAGTGLGSACGSFCGTTALANNDSGDAVGTYSDSNLALHGFIRRSGGHIENFDEPNAGSGAGQGTIAYSINDRGWIAGAYADLNSIWHGFVKKDGTYTTYSDSSGGTGQYQGTETFDINSRGDTAGIYIDSSGVTHGWVCLSSACTNFDPKNSVYTYPCEETCLNSKGFLTGFYEAGTSGPVYGFIRHPSGEITKIRAPHAQVGTVAASINKNGEIGGYYVDSLGSSAVGHSFVRHPDGTFKEFNVRPNSHKDPCASDTVVYSINDDGTTTGVLGHAGGTALGFSRSSDGKVYEFKAGDHTGPCQGTRPSTNNASGEVAGWFTDSNNLNHGFVWTPPGP